ncbi:MAG: lamin tail domain-containing protein [Christensenellaceae bacterium]
MHIARIKRWQTADGGESSAQNEYSVTLNVWSDKGGAKKQARHRQNRVLHRGDGRARHYGAAEQAIAVEQNWARRAPMTSPHFLITEMTPETTLKSEIGGGDRFEFMELYNNSNSPIDLRGFEFRYMNKPGNSSSYALHALDNQNVVIQPRRTFVIWISTQDISNNGKYPAKDMQNYYYDGEKNPAGVELKEDENLGYVHFSGMPNGGSNRGWSIYTKTGELVVEAYYNEQGTNTDVTANKGIQFRYPTDGTKEMQKVSANVYNATPGFSEYQVPKSTVNLPRIRKPVIDYTHENGPYDAVEADGDGVNYAVEATITDDSIVNNAYMEYSLRDDGPETAVRISRAAGGYGCLPRQRRLRRIHPPKDDDLPARCAGYHGQIGADAGIHRCDQRL